MKNKKEWTKNELVVDPDMECIAKNKVLVYLETWFDVDKKFGTKTASDDSAWINLYAEYDVLKHKLKMTYVLSTDTFEKTYRYRPTRTEKELVINLIEETCLLHYGCSVKQYLEMED